MRGVNCLAGVRVGGAIDASCDGIATLSRLGGVKAAIAGALFSRSLPGFLQTPFQQKQAIQRLR